MQYYPNSVTSVSSNSIIVNTTSTGVNNTYPVTGGSWYSLPVPPPTSKHYEIAKKLLADPDFDIGKVILEMVARYINWAEAEFDSDKTNDPIVQKYLNK